MKNPILTFTLIGMIFLIALTSCQSQDHEPEIVNYDSLEVTRNSDRTLTFLQDGMPFTGTARHQPKADYVVIWEVTNGNANKQTGYYSNGQVERTLEMNEEGVEHGSFFMYFEDGKPYVEQYYQHGVPVGTWRSWNNKGELVEEFDPQTKK